MIGLTLEQAGKALRSRNLSRTKTLTIVTFLIGASGGMLAALHGLEAAIWAITYVLLHAVGSLSDALLYSVNSMTTRGASDVVLQHHWKMLGALEAASGMLAFGLRYRLSVCRAGKRLGYTAAPEFSLNRLRTSPVSKTKSQSEMAQGELVLGE